MIILKYFIIINLKHIHLISSNQFYIIDHLFAILFANCILFKN